MGERRTLTSTAGGLSELKQSFVASPRRSKWGSERPFAAFFLWRQLWADSGLFLPGGLSDARFAPYSHSKVPHPQPTPD